MSAVLLPTNGIKHEPLKARTSHRAHALATVPRPPPAIPSVIGPLSVSEQVGTLAAPNWKRGPWSFWHGFHSIATTACPDDSNTSATVTSSAVPSLLHGACLIATMKPTFLIFSLLACLVSKAAATALTFKLKANEKTCFYAVTEKDVEKIAFYFAVRPDSKSSRGLYSDAGRDAHICFYPSRSNLAALSTSIIRLSVPTTRSF